MIRTLALAAPLAALMMTTTALAADAAAAPEKPKRQCFWANQVNSFAAVDENTVNLRVGVRDVYQLEMLGPCHDIDWSNAIGIRSRGSSYICSGLDVELIAQSTIGDGRCQVKTMRKLTPTEIAALPKRGKP